jgi:hypothetical protein
MMSRGNLRRQLFISVYLVPFVEEDYSWLKPFQPGFFNIAVTEDDDLVAYYAFSRSRSVEAYFSAEFFAGDYISFKPFPIVQVADHDLFIRQDAGFFQNIFINCYAAFVRKVRLGYRCHVYLCSQKTSQHDFYP